MPKIVAKVMSLEALGKMGISVTGAVDYLGTGAIEVPIFDREILDIVRRTSVALNRMPQLPATGHPHRYLEQTAVATASAVDPRNIAATASGPTRVERPAFIKAIVAQSNLSLFDRDVTEQQGQFPSVVAKDIDDIISAIEILRAQMLWNGNDTSLAAPTQLGWCGLLTQITQQFTVAPGSSIIDAIKTEVATIMANQTYKVTPTAIITNPLAADYIDQEAKAAKIELKDIVIGGGVTVESLSTQAGRLPIITEAFMPIDTASNYGFSAPPTGNRNYYVAILTEEHIEIPVISGKEYNPNPRLFQLGLTGNLAGQFVGVKFDAVIAKGASYAHAIGVIQRP